MDKRVWWIIGVIVLMILLYVFFKPTGQVVLESGLLEDENQTLAPGNETGENILLPGGIGACGRLNGTGTYTLTNDVVADIGKSCFVVGAADVVLDCTSHNVSGGIVSEQQSGVIKDCNVDSLNVSGNGSLSIRKTMSVRVVSQIGIAVNGANIIINSTNDNGSVSVSGTTNSTGQTVLGGVVSFVDSTGTKVYSSFIVSASLSGFNESSVVISSIQDVSLNINDIAAPVVTLRTGPSVTSNSVRLEFNVQEAGGIQNCTGYVTERSQEFSSASATNVNAGSNSISVGGLDHETDYEAYVKCIDKVGFVGSSLSVGFTTSEESAPATSETETESSESASEESSETEEQQVVPQTGEAIYPVSQTELAAGYTKALKVNDKVKIDIKGGIVFQVVSLGDDSVEVSDGINSMVIRAGEPGKFDFDRDGVYDVSVSLGSIEGDAASLTFLEAIVGAGVEETTEEGGEVQEEAGQAGSITGRAAEEQEGKPSFKTIIILAVIAVLAFVIYRLIKSKKAG